MNEAHSNTNTISFNASRSAHGYMTLGFGCFLAAVFLIAGFALAQQNSSVSSSVVAFSIGIFIGGITIWYWREWLDRTTTLSIEGSYLIVEEHKQGKLKNGQRFGAGQILNVYTVRTWGRGTSYEVWLKLQNNQKAYLLTTWYSQTEAVAIRHFISTQLGVNEVTEHTNKLLG
jgi:hypothetical protein